ncbi:hypothetical protein VIN01S_28060 [Vibrio inusitatus NBRC 102082]|uniref:Alginate lyase n=1 Tax=Vibrio inusitatus NBRC 102082 TaxID=1219070 RepID=A0A4Y3HZI7_9VIBR|nr:polysaccharide lyase 6 family protein [Vibrio inusitatus]GEA52002.1 hypothetical protein VIN01S_28060 [Vibrio inusitatus NBRC 102082]
MNKNILAILIGLVLVGCNDSQDGNNSSGTEDGSNIPATPIDPSNPIPPEVDPPEVDPPEVEDPPVASDVPNIEDMPQGVKTLLSFDPSECTETISSAEYYNKTMTAGTVVCIADGNYSDAELVFGGQGTAESPIKVRALNPGQVIISGGEAKIVMGGEYVQLQGLIFEGGESGSSKLLETRFSSSEMCNNCRITENVFVNIDGAKNLSDEKENGIWVALYGQHNWIDHNIFSGKTTGNPIVSLVRESGLLEEGNAGLAEYTTIYANYFANRPPTQGKMYASSSDNDYEAIRTGLSETHQYAGNSFVVGNLFEQIQGEAEVISNKASQNVVAQNTVRNSYGSITNRHGNHNLIANNFVFGDGFPYSGGLRLVDDGHIVTNNYIEGARYKSTSHHGGIVLLGSDGAGDGGNGYQQLENVHVAFNTVVNSVNSINIDGGGKSKQPQQIYFANNVVDKAIGSVFVDTDRGWSSNSVVVGNIVHGDSFADTDEVVIDNFYSPELEQDINKLYRPTEASNIDATHYDKGEFAAVTTDMDGLDRNEDTLAGADDLTDGEAILSPLTYEDVGPQSYNYEKPAAIIQETVIANYAFADGTEGWSGKGTITNQDAFSYNSSLAVGSDDALYQTVELTPNTNYAVSAFVKGQYNISVGANTFDGEASDSNYELVIHEFTTGNETTGTLSLSLANEVTIDTVQDGNFADGISDFWTTEEDSNAGKGDVGSSSDSAFSSKSARVRFKDNELNDYSATPGISQQITGIPVNTDMIFGLYYSDQKGDESVTTLHFGLKDSDGVVFAEQRVHVSELDDAAQGTNKSHFKQVSLDLNSSSHTDAEIFAYIEIDTSDMTAVEAQQSEDELEVRLDAFTLTYKGTPDADGSAYFDEVRLVKRVNAQ